MYTEFDQESQGEGRNFEDACAHEGKKGQVTSSFSPPSLPISCSPGALLACKNSRFSSFFAAGDVSRGGTSVTQRQEFHTDGVNQCLHKKSSSHEVANLFNFTFC